MKKKIFKNLKKNQIAKTDKQPTNAEIGEAIMILKKAGLWNCSMPVQNAAENHTQDNKKQENDMAKMYMQQMVQQMNNPAYLMMSMNGNNNNSMGGMNMMNMLPFLMNNNSDENGKSAVNKQFLQTMMMSQMMPNLDFTSSDNK